jgi:acyl dehydratase
MGRKRMVATLGYEELEPGDEWESPGRTITEADVVQFAGVSGDFNPLHLDHDFARAGAFGRPVAHGLLGLAVASGLAAHAPKVATQAFLAIESWRFVKPIPFGQTVRLLNRVQEVQPQARGRRARVVWSRRLVGPDGELFQEGIVATLVASCVSLTAGGSEGRDSDKS